MSIENINQIQSVEKDLFGDYGLNGVSLYGSEQEKLQVNNREKFADIATLSLGSDQTYNIPLESIRNEAKSCIKGLEGFVDDMDIVLQQVNLSPDSSPILDETHNHIWLELKNNRYVKSLYPLEEDYDTPDFVCYTEYLYAEKHQCRGCRKFIKEYEKLISTTTFAHLYSFRKIILSLLSEAQCIQQSLQEDFGSDYEDESQQQTATYYLFWLKMATHYKRLFENSIPATPTLLPESELDQVTKKQAAQFQTFFSIRVNSETVNINNQLNSLYKDLNDDCHIFYSKFLRPALRFKSKVANEIELDFRTTNMTGTMPRLAEEAVTAMLSIEGNFKSLLTDLLERRNLMVKKVDSLYQSILQRRKYILYISQLAHKALSKNKIVTDKFDQTKADLITAAVIDRESTTQKLTSSHALLDDLEEDAHPQYLLRSGGVLTGNIQVEQGVTVDGIHLSTHAHSGSDGSVRIKAIDIDFDSVREEYGQAKLLEINDIIDVKIDSFIPDILTGGTPVADVVLSINLPDYLQDKYDFEIQYIEI
jgi:hypothetical protein